MLTLISVALATTPTHPDSLLNPAEDAKVAVRLNAELGFLWPVAHTIQFDKTGTKFDYVEEGGQNLLFPVARLSADADVGRSTFVFLYQPLSLDTKVVLQREISQNGVVFPVGTPLDLKYGFQFWRGSYLYDLLPDKNNELAIGASLQIRDAEISFTSADGTLRTTERDIGPVPVLKVRGRWQAGKRTWLGTEVDGFYAPIKYLNGGDVDVVGAIVDASVRGGLSLGHGADAFLNLRYLGGGASGTSDEPEEGGDGYTDNWLHFVTLSVGFQIR